MSWRPTVAVAILASLGVQGRLPASGPPEPLRRSHQLERGPVRSAEEVKAAGAVLVTVKHDRCLQPGPFSPDGKMLVTCNARSLFLWEVETAKRLGAIDQYCESAAFSPTGNVLAVVRDGIELTKPGDGYEFHTAWTWGLELLSVPELRVLLSGATGQKDPELRPSSLVFSPDGKIIAGDQREHVILFDACTGRKIRLLKPKVMHGKCFGDFYPESAQRPWRGIAYSPDGDTLAHACVNGTVPLWNAEGWKVRATLKPKQPTSAVAFAPDGRLLATAGYAPIRDERSEGPFRWAMPLPIELWDVWLTKSVRRPGAASEKQHEDAEVMCHTGYALDVSFSPDGKLLATSGSNRLKLWEVSSQRTRLTVEFNRLDLCLAVFSPVENTLAVAHREGVELWDVNRLLRSLGDRE